jgi:hypothetical protein
MAETALTFKPLHQLAFTPIHTYSACGSEVGRNQYIVRTECCYHQVGMSERRPLPREGGQSPSDSKLEGITVCPNEATTVDVAVLLAPALD